MNEFETWKGNATVTWTFGNNQHHCCFNKNDRLAGVGNTQSEAFQNASDKAFEAYKGEHMKLTHKQTKALIETEIAAGQHVTYVSNVPMDYSNSNFVQRDIPDDPDELRGIHHSNNTVIYADYADASAEAKEALQNIYVDKNPRLVFVEFI